MLVLYLIMFGFELEVSSFFWCVGKFLPKNISNFHVYFSIN